MASINPYDADSVAEKFGIAAALAREVVYMNDEWVAGEWIDRRWMPETPEQRWKRMRNWVAEQITKSAESQQ